MLFRSGAADTCGGVKPTAVIVPPHELTQIALLALGGSLPVVLVGGLVIRLARSWSLTVSMVALVLIPTLATFAGVFGPLWSSLFVTGMLWLFCYWLYRRQIFLKL